MDLIRRHSIRFALLSFSLVFVLMFSLGLPVEAVTDTTSPSNPTDTTSPSDPNAGKIVNPLADKGIDSIPQFIQTLLEGALKIGIPIIALAIIYSGFLFVFARGNPEKLGTAKQTLLYTLIGAAILLGSWAIATLISNTVGALG